QIGSALRAFDTAVFPAQIDVFKTALADLAIHLDAGTAASFAAAFARTPDGSSRSLAPRDERSLAAAATAILAEVNLAAQGDFGAEVEAYVRGTSEPDDGLPDWVLASYVLLLVTAVGFWLTLEHEEAVAFVEERWWVLLAGFGSYKLVMRALGQEGSRLGEQASEPGPDSRST
ncbi:hypothetical protein, partial [Demequina silvatica]|uniref:hypothetical protein n=1 Tax=Demequina silvatica TaxID=1638988 RepID=UPI00146FFC68